MSDQVPFKQWLEFVATLNNGRVYPIRDVLDKIEWPPYRSENMAEVIRWLCPELRQGYAYGITLQYWSKWVKYCRDHGIEWDAMSMENRSKYYLPEHIIDERRNKLAALKANLSSLYPYTKQQVKMNRYQKRRAAYERQKERERGKQMIEKD